MFLLGKFKTINLGNTFTRHICFKVVGHLASSYLPRTEHRILCERLLYLDYEYMKEGFASMQLRAINVSKFDLLAQAPHSVACNITKISTQGQVWSFFS